MLTDEIHRYIFDGQSHILAASMATWLGSSRRFTEFVNTFRDKIRKKLRLRRDQETLYDLRLELETAYLLLQERNLNLAYEPEQAGPGRSPDFAVTFTTRLTFMVEVTRLRGVNRGTTPDEERLADAICSKLGQLLPQQSNVLIIGMESPLISQQDLQSLMLRIQQRAEGRESVLWQRYGFRDRADFIRHYQRLGEILVRESHWRADVPAVVWVNPQAKHPLPSKVRTALHRSHAIKV